MKLKYFNIAKKLTSYSDHPQHKLGAVIVMKNRIKGLGFNKYKTSPKSPHPYKHIHAEFSAILNAKEDLDGSEIYVFRQKKNGTGGNSRPCKFCMQMLKQAGVYKVHYSIENGYLTEEVA